MTCQYKLESDLKLKQKKPKVLIINLLMFFRFIDTHQQAYRVILNIFFLSHFIVNFIEIRSVLS